MKNLILLSVLLLNSTGISAQSLSFSKKGLAFSSDWTNVCFLDLNKDGYQDIFGSTRADNQTHAFLQNNDDGTFTEDKSNFSRGGYASNSAWVDLEDDGDLDLVLSSQGETEYGYNNGDKGFYFQSAYFKNTSYVDWVDYDNNGWIDYSSGPLLFKQSSMYDFSALPEFDFQGKPTWFDFDNDGDMDIIASQLYRNDAGQFVDVTATAFPEGYKYNGRTISCADYNNNGWIDFFVSNDGEDQLYKNNGDGTFTKDPSLPQDYTNANTSSWADVDNDGDLDLFTSVYMITPNTSLRSNTLYLNNHDGTFTIVAVPVFQFANYESWKISSVAWGDVNNDGLLDLAMSRIEGGLTLFTNTSVTINSWLGVQLTGTESNTFALGARVIVTASIGGTEEKQVREITLKNGGGQNSSIAAFGLGDATEILSVEVRWPSGIVTVLQNVDVNQVLEITEDRVTSLQYNSSANGKILNLYYDSKSSNIFFESNTSDNEVWITDAMGKIVKDELHLHQGMNLINMKDVPEGMYLIRSKTDPMLLEKLIIY